MRLMHELKIPNTILNAIDEGGHAMDLQLYHDGEGWTFNESWGKRKLSDFSNGNIVLIDYASNGGYGTHSRALGYISTEGSDTYIRLLGSMSIIDKDDNYYSIIAIIIKSDYDDIGPSVAEGVKINGFEDDAINIYKL